MSKLSKEALSYVKSLNDAGFDPIVPGGDEETESRIITIENAGGEDLVKLLEDAAKYLKASKSETTHFEKKESLFKRLDTGDYVAMVNRC